MLPVVWAVDAFCEQKVLDIAMAESLSGYLADNRETPVIPVYVLNERSFLAQGASTFLRPAIQPMAIKQLQSLKRSINKQFRTLNLQTPKILIEESTSKAQAAVKLLRFADQVRAGAIALSSRAPRSFLRLSSFSEELLKRSRKPLLINGPHTQALREVPTRHLVLATDFFPGCEHAIGEIVSLADALRAEIHLFHKLIRVEDTGSPLPHPYQQLAAHWANQAKLAGVELHSIFENFREPTGRAIVDYVRELKETTQVSILVATLLRTGPLASLFTGSVTREVIQASPCPIYVAPRL